MSLTTAVIHDVKNRLAELAMRLANSDPGASSLALEASRKLAQLLLVEGQALAPHIDAHAPADLLDELAAEYRDLYPDKDIVTDTEAAPALWYYDVGLLRMALANAVHNALRHGRQRVWLQAGEVDNTLVLTVKDDGEGFPPAVLAGDFHSSADSTGLGLRIAHNIAEAHQLKGVHGRVELANEGGAVLRLILP